MELHSEDALTARAILMEQQRTNARADSILDHTKYFAVSREWFPMPKNGSLQFSVDIKSSTPGTQPGKVVHGYDTDTRDGSLLYAQPTTSR
jgi:hypothetical protein